MHMIIIMMQKLWANDIALYNNIIELSININNI